MPTKKDCQERHARRRFAERYGIRLRDHLRRSIIDAIRSGRARLVDRQSHRVAVYDVDPALRPRDYVGNKGGPERQTVRVVYDRLRETLSTALTTDMDPLKKGLR